jgi:3-phosphoshikimate 1-carboxyvinyltransferase
LLHDFGWEVKNDDHKRFYFPGKQNTIEGQVNYRVEGDWSGAAFLLVAGAISLSRQSNAGSIIVTGLDPESTQADREVIQALISADTAMSIRDGEIEIRKSKLKAFQFDATECPGSLSAARSTRILL